MYDPGWEQYTDDTIIESITGKSCDVLQAEKLNHPSSTPLQFKKLSIQNAEDNIKLLHNLCQAEDGYTLSDYRVFKKWEKTFAGKSSDPTVAPSPQAA